MSDDEGVTGEFRVVNPGDGSGGRPQASKGKIATRDPLALVFYILARDHLAFGPLSAAVNQARALMKKHNGQVSMENAAFATACAELALVVRGEGP